MVTSYPQRDISNQLRVHCCEHVVHLNFILLVENMYHYMIVYDITHIHIYVYTNVHIIHMYLLRVPLCNSPINIHIWFYHKLCKLSYLRCRSVGRSFLHGPESIPEWRTLFFLLSYPVRTTAGRSFWKVKGKAGCTVGCYMQFSEDSSMKHTCHIFSQKRLSVSVFFFCFTSSPLSQ